jgi:hypothetical protein
VKKYILASFVFIIAASVSAQDSTSRSANSRDERRAEKRQRINAMIKQEEEGVLSYHKQSAFGLQLRTNGYGLFYELGRAKTPRFTNLYMIELTEIKDPREDRSSGTGGFLGNPLIYGKINNFYQAKLGFGQQYIFGQKGNKNGIAVMGIYQAGLSLGLLKPYYVTVNDNNTERDIKYEDNNALFLEQPFAGAGFTKGWNDLEFEPGAFIKGALRFDFGRYNEQIQAVQIGLSVEGYSKKVPIMALHDGQRLFFQGHLAFLFGRRK